MSSNLPPSSRYVRDVLEREGPLSRQDLLDRVDLPARTLDHALEVLSENGHVEKTTKPDDAKQVVCKICE